jgi:5-methylcytosine-specific restriction enzyme A
MNYFHTRVAVFDRDGGKCLRCLGDATDVHHRRVKGMGGSKDPITHGMANLISLCRDCHTFTHDNPGDAYKYGFLVKASETPADVPVWVGTREKMLLFDDGTAYKGTSYVWY